ncbi:MAG: flagellar biosynthesis anti-sigma factor FlgM [Candidatus Acidiferrales bacterium]
MRIDSLFGTPIDPESNRVGGASSSSSPTQADRAGADAAAGNEDGASISTAAQKLAQFSAQLGNTPEIRQDRVAQLTDSIQSGTYSVSNRQIAESILNDLQSAGASLA